MRQSPIMILTNCTNRKRIAPPQTLLARSLGKGRLSVVSRRWVSKLCASKNQYEAAHLYCGRAISEIALATEALRAQTIYISAGLGVVPQFHKIPAYGLTVAQGHEDSIGGRILGPYDSASWWEALAQARGLKKPLKKHIERHQPRLVLVAMPATYVAMITNELAALGAKTLKAVRIVGPRRRQELPESLRDCWLPYDARLDNPRSGFNGTAADFPHRALRHFALHVLPKNLKGSRAAHAAEVDGQLSRFRAYVRPRGRTVTDAQLLPIIKRIGRRLQGKRTLMLRELRDNVGVACEQKRFQRLAIQLERSSLAAS